MLANTSLILTTENVFQAISPGLKTLGLPAPSTQSLPHSTGQRLTKDGVLHQPAVGRVVTFAVQLGIGQFLHTYNQDLK